MNNKTQAILVGSPLELTTKGILELHNRMYNTNSVFGILKSSTNENYPKVNKLNDTDIESFLLGKEDEYERLLPSTQNYLEKPLFEELMFSFDWEYPGEDKRQNKFLLDLFQTDNRREYFNYEGRPKIYCIPGDVEWELDTTECGTEYIRERARIWR